MDEGEIFLDDTVDQSVDQNEIDDDSEMDEDFDDFIESSGIVVHTSTLTQSNKRPKHNHNQQVPKWSNDILIQSFNQSINQYKYMHKQQCPSWSDCQPADVVIPTIEVPESPKQSEQSNIQSKDQSKNLIENTNDHDGIQFGEPLDTETPEHDQPHNVVDPHSSNDHMYPPGLSLPVHQLINTSVDQSNNHLTYPTPPAPVNEQEALQGMLSSYYNTGFYAGYYQAMRQMSAASNSGPTS